MNIRMALAVAGQRWKQDDPEESMARHERLSREGGKKGSYLK